MALHEQDNSLANENASTVIETTTDSQINNPFPMLIKPTLIICNKSGTLKIPHEHFKRGCTNFKRSQTIMN